MKIFILTWQLMVAMVTVPLLYIFWLPDVVAMYIRYNGMPLEIWSSMQASTRDIYSTLSPAPKAPAKNKCKYGWLQFSLNACLILTDWRLSRESASRPASKSLAYTSYLLQEKRPNYDLAEAATYMFIITYAVGPARIEAYLSDQSNLSADDRV